MKKYRMEFYPDDIDDWTDADIAVALDNVQEAVTDNGFVFSLEPKAVEDDASLD